MPLTDVPQPEHIVINEGLRLRKYDGRFDLFLPGYQDPYVYQNSEGIFDEARKPDLNYVKGMCTYLDGVGELYFIEAKEGDNFVPIGDVTVKAENPPIAIWREKYRGRGIGTLVMQAVIDRLKQLGFHRVKGSTVYRWNLSSQRMHERLGFRLVDENEKELTYDLDLNGVG